MSPKPNKLNRKKVLIVTYYWPPSGGGGVQRWVKFAKYLSEYGWDPIIYTPENPDVPIIDNSLVSDIPTEITIIKRPIFEPYRVSRMLGGKKASGRMGATASERTKNSTSVLTKITRWIRGNIFVPDARVAWVKPSAKYLKGWLNQNSVDLIVTTGPPHSMHLIGLQLKGYFPNIPWVSDFRDPWSDMDYLKEFMMSSRAEKKMLKMEADVVNKADRIVVTSPSVATTLLGKDNHPKSVLLPNGWDPIDFNDGGDKDGGNYMGTTFRIGHFGSLHGSRNAPGLWRAVEVWNNNLRGKQPRIELIFAGTVVDSVKESILKSRLSNDVVFLGELDHESAVKEMSRCNGLLLIHNDTESARKSTPGKIFEYLACQLPIISICNSPSDLAERLTEWGLPFAGHDDKDAITKIIESLDNQPTINAQPYERKVLTEKLALVFNELVK